MILKMLLIIAFYYPLIGLSQCELDVYGSWVDEKEGVFFHTATYTINTVDPPLSCIIGRGQDTIYGSLRVWKGMVKITDFRSVYNEKGELQSRKKLEYFFEIWETNTQLLRLKAVSEDARCFFGSELIELYNQDYLTWDQIEPEQLYVSFWGAHYIIELDDGEVYKREYTRNRRKKKYNYYWSQLAEADLPDIVDHVLASGIFNMSKCERIFQHYSDTFPNHICVKHNSRVTSYEHHRTYDHPLVYNLYSELIEKLSALKFRKWKATPATYEKTYRYYYHDGKI